MILRIERKKGENVVFQVLAVPGISDGDLAVLLEDAAMDMRFNLVEAGKTRFLLES